MSLNRSIVLIAFLFVVLLYDVSNVSAGGCVAQPVYVAADVAGQAVRYDRPDQLRLINKSIVVAYIYGAPEWWVRHLLIAKRYWLAGHVRLARYHLFKVSKRPCW